MKGTSATSHGRDNSTGYASAADLEGCADCDYYNHHGAHKHTSDGMTIRCEADPVKGLTPVAQDKYSCKYFNSAMEHGLLLSS